ncbi:glycosyltransferase family 4 protein [Asticcacaulis sp. AND118]|uniref:glycosyltransferase family 4 protein n=1 Tax=Asticcacaulis sp. AND118 TaxID=2840468 RepID=UPI001CFFA60E|nr:glycosyltransferase family 4 protein [Asticcacaulis sp. AND118]UDF04105.1 glycosyltransferase family 4 protein [Asticcacaulis sp. AND118]
MLQDKHFAVETEAQSLQDILDRARRKMDAGLARVAVMGNFPPRQCGLATFTRDIYACLHEALPAARFEVIAMDDHAGPYAYPPEVTRHVPQDDAAAYRQLAADLNAARMQVLFVQHEFGIFGGPAGAHLLECLERVTMPVVTTLHTVLENPNPDQRRVMEGLIRLSSTLITMAHKGADILKRVYGVPESQILVVPHGAPGRSLRPTSEFKAALEAEGRPVISTFGLLSPNKGIETIIEALPAISEACPDVLYFVVGATHPNLILNEGEAYRESLIARAKELGVEDHIRFINRFMSDNDLIDVLQATDVYVTPYLTETQITSGTLSYALAVGKPVVSAPYWHAVEALADGIGVVCPFRDSAAFGAAIIDLLTDDAKRQAMAERAYAAALPSRWSAVAAAYTSRAGSDIRTRAPVIRVAPSIGSAPAWRAVLRLSDDCGMAQHSRYRLPDRAHGYCTDDNARALMMMARRAKFERFDEYRIDLTYRYAGFVNHAWNGDNGRFRNFMGFSRQWLDEGGSDDCCARAFESLIEVARSPLPDDMREWARELAQRVLPHVESWDSQRARAVVLRALDAAIGHVGEASEVLRVMADIAAPLHAGYRHNAAEHAWFEPALSYDNARLPEGLLLAGHRLGDTRSVQDAMSALVRIMGLQTAEDGHFRPIATRAFAAGQSSDGGREALFDQQPLEAQASLEACLTAWRVTGEETWKAQALRGWQWFRGENDHGLSLMTDDGGCFDGLTVHGLNQNQGAESVLALHLSWCALKDAGL